MVGVNVYSNHPQIRFQYICLLFRYIVFHWSVFTETHGKGYRILRLFWTSAYLKYITTFSRGLKYMPKWVWSVFRGSHSHKGENNHLYRNFYWEKSAWSEYGLLDDVEKRVEWGKSWYDRTMNIIRNGDKWITLRQNFLLLWLYIWLMVLITVYTYFSILLHLISKEIAGQHFPSDTQLYGC